MRHNISTMDAPQVKETAKQLSSAVVVLPFDPKMTPRQQLEVSLRTVLANAEKQLLAGEAADKGLQLIKKLRQVVRGLNYSTHKKSIALFVSAEVEKVCYMDMDVEERVIINEPFRVRDLSDCQRKDAEYLVLLLSANQSKMYRGYGRELQLIKSNTPQNMFAYLNEVPEQVANFSDPDARREEMLNKFLHHMDQGLSAVLKVYPLPVFVIGTNRVTGHFSSITRNEKSIAAYVCRNCLEAKEKELREILQPELDNWQALKQRMTLRQIEKALDAGKLVRGIEEVQKAANCRNSRLLVIENDRPVAGEKEERPPFYKEDIVDSIAEKVLENGGEVQSIDRGLLKDHGHIVLVRYF